MSDDHDDIKEESPLDEPEVETENSPTEDVSEEGSTQPDTKSEPEVPESKKEGYDNEYYNPCKPPVETDNHPVALPTVGNTEEGLIDRFIRDITRYSELVKSMEDVDSEKVAETLNTMRVFGDQLSEIMEFTQTDPNALNKENSSQYLRDSKNRKVSITHPKINFEDGDVVSGTNALHLVSKISSMGEPSIVILPHSGFIIRLSDFSEASIVTLNLKLEKRRTELGYATKGASYSGDNVYLIGTIVEFILENCVYANIKGWDIPTIKRLLKVGDIQTLLAGALETIYPSGYPYIRICTSDDKDCDANFTTGMNLNGEQTVWAGPDKDKYFPEGMFNFDRSVWINRDLLPSNYPEMLTYENENTPASVIEYQEELDKKLGNTLHTLIDNEKFKMDITLKHPSMKDYLSESNRWVQRISGMADQAIKTYSDLGQDEMISKRNSVIEDYLAALDLQRHTAWIKQIRITSKTDPDGSKEAFIEDKDAIENALRKLSGPDGRSDELLKILVGFKNHVTVVGVGIPDFNCPKCHKGQTNPAHHKNTPTVIPVNMVGFFFTIMALRLSQGRV